MRKLSWLFVLAFMAYACELGEEIVVPINPEDGFSKNNRSAWVAGGYDVDVVTTDGFNFTVTIDQSNAQDISHIVWQMTDCYGEFLTYENISNVYVNSVAWTVTMGTPPGAGGGTGCYFDLPFFKFDNFDMFEDVDVVVITFTSNVQSEGGAFKIKSASGCFEYTFEGYCEDTPECYQEETAWAGGMRYVAKGNWATYTAYEYGKTVTLWAGQHNNAGTVKFENDMGDVKITITLAEGWSLQDFAEAVKIQGYATTPPASNPAPGQFTTYKGNDLIITLGEFAFYGIHVDVQKLVECPMD
jgi:hypothetical protein